MNPFLSPPRTAIVLFSFLLAAGSSGCGGGTDTSSSATGAGGTGGGGGATGGTTESPCDNAEADTFAELTAPEGDSFGEAVIAATDKEVAVAYTQWHDATRDVTVYLQRFSLAGAPLGAPALLHTYNESYGQLAAGDFYGSPSIATDGTRFVACWGEGLQSGCGAVAAGSGEASFHAITSPNNGFAYVPRVTFDASGFRVFVVDPDVKGRAWDLDEQANPGAGVVVPATLAVATDTGYAAASYTTGAVFRLGPDLTQQAGPFETSMQVEGIASLGGVLSVVGRGKHTFLDVAGQATSVQLGVDYEIHRMAVAARNGVAAVAWTANDTALHLTELTPALGVTLEKHLGCSATDQVPFIAAVADGFLIAATPPEGAHELFYATGYPRLRILHIALP